MPDYLAAITDFTTIEPDLRHWEREKEVAHSQTWFESNETSVPPAAETLDLRLAFLAEEARLQWRTRPDAAFADLKQAQAKRFGENIERGTLTITPIPTSGTPSADGDMAPSVVIPIHNEGECLETEVAELTGEMDAKGVDYELILAER